MDLRLKHAPIPQNAPLFAEMIVEAAARASGVHLDYSVESLEAVDDILESMRHDGLTTEVMGETMFGFGCYVGEVFVRAAGARWIESAGTQMRDLAGFPMILQLGTALINPIGKTFKRLDNGMEDNLPYFFRAFAGEPS